MEFGHAPLKPQQNVQLLTGHLLPRLSHRLQLGEFQFETLEEGDLLVRKALRTWLHLPHDVQNEFFYAKVRRWRIGCHESLRADSSCIESLVSRELNTSKPTFQWW